MPQLNGDTDNGTINVTVKNGKMTIIVPIHPDPPLSSTGKTRLAYSTHGVIASGDYKINLNVMV